MELYVFRGFWTNIVTLTMIVFIYNRGDNMAKLIDLTGQVFGKLTVLKRDDSRSNKGTYWWCQCECGNKISVRKDQLTRAKGPKTSCGCDLKEKNSKAHLKDITGQTFGKLTVIHRVTSRPGSKAARWLCKCECGKECEVDGIQLRNGSVQSCGCKRYESHNGIDETGKRYGKLLVLGRSPVSLNSTHIFWRCRCDCGAIKDINGTYLRSGASTSCGCERSTGEYKITQLLNQCNIPFKREYSFSDLLGLDGGRLRFDFGILKADGSLAYLIEYDGVQHFQSNCFGADEQAFIKLQQHDQLKNDYCQKHNIPLIRIPYTKLKTLSIKDLIYLK